MTGPPATRPTVTSAEGPAPQTKAEVFVRDFSGENAVRLGLDQADELVSRGLADRVSAAGHIRLKLGIRAVQVLRNIHGMRAVEISRLFRGDAKTAGELKHRDRITGLRWRGPARYEHAEKFRDD